MATGSGSNDQPGARPRAGRFLLSAIAPALLAAHLAQGAGLAPSPPHSQPAATLSERFVATLVAEGSISSVASCNVFYLCVAVEPQFHGFRREDRRRIGALLYRYAVEQRLVPAGRPFAVAFIDSRTGGRIGRYLPENGRWLAG